MATLVALARAQQHPAAAALDATLLTNLLLGASEWVELYCNRKFASATFTEIHSGDGTSILHLDQLPITALTSVTILDDDGTSTVLASTDFRYDPQTGELRFAPDPDGDYTYFPRGFRNVTVVYVAGFAAVPDAVQDAVVEIALTVAAIGKQAGNLASERLGDYAYTLRNAAAEPGGILSPATRSTLAMYKVYGIG